ncbi:MAG: ribosome silencing factor [Blastocatellia bacterium]
MAKVQIKEKENEKENKDALSPEDQAVLEQVRLSVEAADDKKAIDPVVLRLAELTEFTDYFVICTGNSTRQTQAIADAVTDKLKSIRLRPMHTEGYNNGEWILLDYGSFVFHVFTGESRRFYDLERLWRDAVKVSVL